MKSIIKKVHPFERRHQIHPPNPFSDSIQKTEFQISPIKSHKDAIMDAAIEEEENDSINSMTANQAECEIVCNPETFDPQVWL